MADDRFSDGKRRIIAEIVRADGACLILKSKSCFSDVWRHRTDFLEIGGCQVFGSLPVYVGIVLPVIPEANLAKKRLFSNRGFQFPGSEKSRKIVRRLQALCQHSPVPVFKYLLARKAIKCFRSQQVRIQITAIIAKTQWQAI